MSIRKKQSSRSSEDMSLKDFSDLPFIFFDKRDSLFYNWCRVHFKQIPRGVKPRLIVNSFGNMLMAVSKGLGCAVLPYHVYKRSMFFKELSTLGSRIKLPESGISSFRSSKSWRFSSLTVDINDPFVRGHLYIFRSKLSKGLLARSDFTLV